MAALGAAQKDRANAEEDKNAARFEVAKIKYSALVEKVSKLLLVEL